MVKKGLNENLWIMVFFIAIRKILQICGKYFTFTPIVSDDLSQSILLILAYSSAVVLPPHIGITSYCYGNK
jgi:hypothetical protein